MSRHPGSTCSDCGYLVANNGYCYGCEHRADPVVTIPFDVAMRAWLALCADALYLERVGQTSAATVAGDAYRALLGACAESMGVDLGAPSG